MTPAPNRTYPSAAVKVRLLQDAVYAEDAELWSTLMRYQAHIEGYFREIGLELIIHGDDGFAYLKQSDGEEHAGTPRLFRRDKLTKGVAIIGVILREQLLHFDESLHDETRLTLRREELLQLASPFFPETNDKIRDDKRLDNALNRAEEMGLLRKLTAPEGEETYEIRRIVKARFPVELLRDLRQALLDHASINER
jgi:hypothetical protein